MERRPRYVYTGAYTESRRRTPVKIGHPPSGSSTGPLKLDLPRAATYLECFHSSLKYNVVALATIFLVVILSYMLPNISLKINRTSELKAMKNMLDVMTKEVSRAEVACFTFADQLSDLHASMHDGATDTGRQQRELGVGPSTSPRTTQSAPTQAHRKIGFFRRIFFPCRNTSNKEVAIMSYVYTDSFDKNKNNPKPETNPAEPINI